MRQSSRPSRGSWARIHRGELRTTCVPPSGDRPDTRRRPRQALRARYPPAFVAVGQAVGGDEATALPVVLDHDQVADDHRRAGRIETPVRLRRRHLFPPSEAALHVGHEETLVSEHEGDVRAVGRGRRVGIRALDVTRLPRRGLVQHAHPELASAGGIEAVQPPLVLDRVLREHDAFGFGVEHRAGRHGAQHVDALLPDDRARVRQPGDRRAPADAGSVGGVPGRGQRRLGDAARALATERRPVRFD